MRRVIGLASAVVAATCLCGCACTQVSERPRVAVAAAGRGYRYAPRLQGKPPRRYLSNSLANALTAKGWAVERIEDSSAAFSSADTAAIVELTYYNYNIDGSLLAGIASAEAAARVVIRREGRKVFEKEYEDRSSVIVPQPAAFLFVLVGGHPAEKPTRDVMRSISVRMNQDVIEFLKPRRTGKDGR